MGNSEFTVDLSTLLRILKKYAAVVVIFTILTTAFAFMLAEFMLPKRYSATAKFYIENSRIQSEIIQVSDINAARNMVNTCAELFSTRDITQKLKDATGAPYTTVELMDMIRMSPSNNTEYLRVTLTASDPEIALRLLRSFVEICIEEFDLTIDSGRIRVVESAYPLPNHVFPNTGLFVVVGFLAGFALTFVVVFVKEILDIKVKAEDDLFRIYDIPVFAEVICFDIKVKGEYAYE
ncbi:MAG: Wzz/FepE/Etk N-terminal domain-containing protein [Oscillospiraceae bacterium]|nr:Wzz/FepE/Etk N-terminal domain-containing protein [Oscillospiraceae bacterium]